MISLVLADEIRLLASNMLKQYILVNVTNKKYAHLINGVNSSTPKLVNKNSYLTQTLTHLNGHKHFSL